MLLLTDRQGKEAVLNTETGTIGFLVGERKFEHVELQAPQVRSAKGGFLDQYKDATTTVYLIAS